MKKCTKCKIEKDVLCFSKHSGYRDGLQSWCRVCHNAQTIAYIKKRKANDEAYRQKLSSQSSARIKKRKANDEAYRQKRSSQSSVYNKKRYANDPEFRARHNHRALLRTRKLEDQFNSLSSIEQLAILDFYIACPEGYEVDHIYPVVYGGLHCLSNLQYLTAEENGHKLAKIPSNTDIDGKIFYSKPCIKKEK